MQSILIPAAWTLSALIVLTIIVLIVRAVRKKRSGSRNAANPLSPHSRLSSPAATTPGPIAVPAKDPSKPQGFKESMAAFGGADHITLRQVGTGTQTKRFQFGATILTIIAFTSIVSGIAYGNIWNVFAGIGTFALMFWLTRAIEIPMMISLDTDWAHQIANGETVKRISWKTLPAIVGRVIMISALSAISSGFVLMIVLNPEIQEKVAHNRQNAIADFRTFTDKKVADVETLKTAAAKPYVDAKAKYDKVLSDKRAYITKLREDYMEGQHNLIGEIEGRVGSGLMGDGPAAKEKRTALLRDSIAIENMQKDLDSNATKIPEYSAMQSALADRNKAWEPLDKQIAQLHADEDKKIADLKSQKMDGLIQRMEAMNQVAADSPLYYLYFIFLFMVECLPLIMKIMLGPDEYTFALAMQYKQYVVEKFLITEEKLLQKEFDYQTKFNDLSQKLADAKALAYEKTMQNQNRLANKQVAAIQNDRQNIERLENELNSFSSVDPEVRKNMLKKLTKDYITAQYN